MASYRLYCLTENGRISCIEDFSALGDQEAMSKVPQIKPDSLLWELWEGDRLAAESPAQYEAAVCRCF